MDPDAGVENSTLGGPVRIEEGVVVHDSSLGPNVTLERCVLVEGSTLVDVIVGEGASIESSNLRDSMVGNRARISGFSGSLSVAADSEVAG